MRTKEFIHFQNIQYMFRWRWLLPIPTGLMLGYWASNVITMLSNQSMIPPGAVSPDNPIANTNGNALEAFIWAFSKPEIIYYVATVLFIYLISDFLPDTPYGQWALIRFQSRTRWWGIKVYMVFQASIVYCGLLFGSFFLPVTARFPFSSGWSPAGLNNFGMGIGYSIKNGGPIQGASTIALLLFLGWFAFGLLNLLINQLTQRSWVGFLAGALVIICGNLGSIFGGAINQTGWPSYFLIYNHLEYTPLWVPIRDMPISISFLFWIGWISICTIIGLISAKHQDFLSTNN